MAVPVVKMLPLQCVFPLTQCELILIHHHKPGLDPQPVYLLSTLNGLVSRGFLPAPPTRFRESLGQEIDGLNGSDSIKAFKCDATAIRAR